MLTKSQIKYIQSLSHKKIRTQEQVFIAEGIKIVNEFLSKSIIACKQLYCTQEYYDAFRETFRSVACTIITEAELKKISLLTTPNKVLAIFAIPNATMKEDGLVLLLDGIQDPGNFGTIVRTAHWFGYKNILCSVDCVDAYNPKVVQASMGSIVAVNITYTDLTSWMKNYKYPILATTPHGSAVSGITLPGKGALVIGNEGQGIRNEVLALCTHRITIPRIGDAESLNAAVAASIVMAKISGIV
jgi:RNA methyltransferase, TrmH family